MIPKTDELSNAQIFDNLALARLGGLLKRVVPKRNIINWAFDKLRFEIFNKTPEDAVTIREVEAFNDAQRKEKVAAYAEKNIGDRKDWYTDAVFAQQAFTGTNPVSIRLASSDLISEFKTAATSNGFSEASRFLDSLDEKSLYVNDYRYFRKAMKVAPDHTLTDIIEGFPGEVRYGNAAVVLYHLTEEGALHPLAIVIDYKVRMDQSVVIFNKRLKPSDCKDTEEGDWPWRYAKMCAAASDWVQHELATHLTNTHFIEEAVIVAAQRSLEPQHPVFRILQPHWYKTLSLNAAARKTLMPDIILDLIGCSAEEAHNMIIYEYENFNWVGNYVPNDLKRRGFPASELNDKKFHNYSYGRNIYKLWFIIRQFVAEMLAASGKYSSNKDVENDRQLDDWCHEMRTGGGLRSFPAKFHTLDALIDAITMSIHISSPQHTAVNYLQQYYQSFIPNKPAALCQELPKSLKELKSYAESDYMAALPVRRPREWLLMSHVPWLLSFRVNEKHSLAAYAKSLHSVNKYKVDPEGKKVAAAADKFYNGLRTFEKEMFEISGELDDKTAPYTVLDPDENAVSILI